MASRGSPSFASVVVAGRFCPSGSPPACSAGCGGHRAEGAPNTSWAYVLPDGVLAVAALGQMLVICRPGSTSPPGVTSRGNLIVESASDRTAACIRAARLPRPRRGRRAGQWILVGIVRRNPLIVTLAVGQIVRLEPALRTREHELAPGAAGVVVLGARQAARHQHRFWMGAGITLAFVPVFGTRAGPALQAVGANPTAPGWPAACPHASSRLHRRRRCTPWRRSCSPDPHQHRPGLRGQLPARTDRRRRDRGRALRRTGERNIDGRRTRIDPLTRCSDPGLSTALQFIVFGAAIIAGMLISGDRAASLLGRALRPSEAPPVQPAIGNNPS